jgi:glucose/arabinose dehydrogenase/PKD repeat protein
MQVTWRNGPGGRARPWRLIVARDGRRCAAPFLVALLFLTPSAVHAQTAPPTPVAAYAFNEGAGTSTADLSGSGNAGTVAGATWTTQGKFGNALSFNGTSAMVTVADAPSLRLTSGMTLEAWLNPSSVTSTWRDTLVKGNDDYYLIAMSSPSSLPAGAATTAGTKKRAFGTSSLAPNTWTHLATTYDGTAVRLYVNGTQVSSTPATGTIATSASALQIGGDSLFGQFFAGSIDEVRVYNVALSAAQIQADMTTPLVSGGGADTTPPSVSITSPASNAQVSNIVTVSATASDDTGVAGVQFLVDGVATGSEDPTPPYGLNWDTRTTSNGAHTLTARARDAAGNSTLSAPITVNVANTSQFQNEILATGFNLPTNIEFMPDGRMLVAEFTGTIKVLPPPYTQADATPFLQITNIAPPGPAADRGIFDLALDPQFSTNHYFYVFYTAGSPERDRLSRFTANAALNGTIAGSEVVLWQDPQDTTDADQSHHGGAITFGNDGKIYLTVGDHFVGSNSQSLTTPRGKLLRINPDGTIPTDNPFYDGAGPNVDSIWALGLRNPYRSFYDAPTGRLYIGNVGGNDTATSYERLELGARGANYGWPNCEVGTCGNSAYTAELWSYPHAGRDACITVGFVYHGSQFPSSYQGSLFVADYAQNWIKRLTFDTNGNVNGVYNFEPPDGSADGPYGDIVDLQEGPDGALYYVDIGYGDTTGQTAVSKIRRIRYTSGNQAPIAAASANPTSGQAPLTVNFSSAGSSDPEGQPLSYSWTFGDNTTSTAANPTHTYATAGQYTARLTVSDGTNATLAPPVTINAGNPPTATVTSPIDGTFFNAGDVISFSGTGTDPDDGTMPASAFTWNIDFLHEGHVHPGTPVTGVTSGTFTIPTSGHDFSGNTRYRISLTVTDSSGLSSTQSVIIWPRKVNLTFDTAPSGLTLYLDGIAYATPFVHDTLIGFNHTIEARNQSSSGSSYTFSSWSDGGAQTHTLVVPSTNQSYLATYTVSAGPTPVAAYSFNEGSGTSVADASGNGNGGAIGTATWSTQGKYGNALSFNGTSAKTTVADSASLHLTSGMTLEAWVNPSAVTSAWRDVIVKGDDDYYLMATSTPSSLPVGAGIFGGVKARAFGTSPLALNTWTYLATTYDGANLKLYVNGLLVSTTPKAGTIQTSTNPLQFGGDAIYGQYFSGLIDEVRVYNGALTQAQVQTDMSTPLGGGTSDTQPPTAPTNLQATASGSTQIGLTWTAATDNVGVTGYRVERCQGAGCSNFAQIATPANSPFTDTGLTPGTSYSYRVRAVDAASNLGPYSNTATATTQAASTTLVAAYSFNEGSGTSTADISGSGNVGAISNATWTTQGKYGNALSFNGTNAKVTVADAASLHLTSGMTLEAWVNPSAVTSAWRDVLVKGSDDFYLMATSSPSSAPAAAVSLPGKKRAFGTTALPLNTWTHLAATYNGSFLKLYMNGVEVSSAAATGTIATSVSLLSIGGDPLFGQYFAGKIDEVRVYNGARTGAQINSDMGTPLALAVRSSRTVQNSSPSPRAMTSNVFQRIARSLRRSVLAPTARAASMYATSSPAYPDVSVAPFCTCAGPVHPATNSLR